MEYKKLNRKGIELSKEQLEKYLEKLASEHVLQKHSDKETYPIPQVKENFEFIKQVYHLLNEHIKIGIPIHPAGEWLLDNFYIIEETVKTIIQNMPLKKYKEFLGISNGADKGFARIYALAYEIINYTDNRINYNNVSDFLLAYQKKKTLSMNEIWNIGIFMQIAIIQSITDICEKIYFSQIQKYRAENIIERLVENKKQIKYKNLPEYKAKIKEYGQMKYPFIEYLSYRLKKEGKSGLPFLNILEEQVNKMGTTVDEIVKKQHYDIALKKVSIANCITSIKELIRMDFLSIFEETNGVEEILKEDPSKIYKKMDYKTKEYYRNEIEQISKKTKIAEIYIAKKALELAKENAKEDKIIKQSHIGYYLIDEGKKELYKKLQQKEIRTLKNETKVVLYISTIWIISYFIDILFMIQVQMQIRNFILTTLLGIILILPIQEIVVQIMQYLLTKIVKPKLIPKMDFYNGIPEEESCFVVIPTILNSKEKVIELMKKLEVYYLANKSENIYFALLGDCSSGKNKQETHDKEVIEEGLKQVELLNEKYKNNIDGKSIPKFHFIYRKRYWNGREECYLGWERKRGLLNQFNNFILEKIDNPFLVNTIQKILPKEIKEKIKYVITLDADTELVLNTGFELIGSMAHILNKPILNKEKDLVIEGHALIQPRIGINLEVTNKNLFTKIFAGNGGIDNYTNAISDIYQDNFEEGIFTGKGIYDISIFSQVLENEIPENTVLSHDLLEGNYLRCGLASDIILMDGYPSSYISFKKRLHRWIRGDFQIIRWANKIIINKKEQIKKNPLNPLSIYKIIDNLIRAVIPVFILLSIITVCIYNILYSINTSLLFVLLIVSVTIPTILDLIGNVIYKKEGQIYQKTFTPRIPSWLTSIVRGILKIMCLPDKAYYSSDAIIRTIYRIYGSKKHLLEWTTSEDAEKTTKNDLLSYYKSMMPNVIFAILTTLLGLIIKEKIISVVLFILSIIWLIGPIVFWYISKNKQKEEFIKEINKDEKQYLYEIGKKTWQFFKDSITKENNYLPPDNYQEDRKVNFIERTSSTNIGLGILSVISSYDLKYENLEDTLELLKNMITIVEELPKWNGHLYNWYNIKTLEPLTPRYISTVDNGNFVGYIYVLKQFYQEIKQKIENEELEEKIDKLKKDKLLNLIPDWINKPINEIKIANCDFSKLYDEERGIFSIGFNIEENKLTDSYYDLLASEARQASLIAISKKDVPSKHWRYLSRTMTTMNGYNGLISWSGTAFEYLMPNMIIKQPEGSLIDESIKFMIMSQKQYAKKLSIPWGFSEAAYYLKDLNNNYQYKAIGIPWLGLKRGIEEDIVVSSYASIMALTSQPKEVIQNIKILEKQGMYDKYGFYESIDYTPMRMPKGKKQMVTKTYMAHHQGLILLSINNFFNNNILQKRFSNNPEISAIEVLLQENVPEKRIITKEEKQKPSKITYHDYGNYAQRIYTKSNYNIPICNVISSNNYSIIMNLKAEGYSKYKNYLINKYFSTSNEAQGIFFYIKNIKNKKIWTSSNALNLSKADKFEITFSEDKNKIKRIDGSIETICNVTLSPKDPIEIRDLKLINNGIEEETIEITTAIEPLLTTLEEYISHPAFQNLFLTFEYDEEKNIFIVKRKNRENPEKDLYMAVSFFTKEDTIGELEYEIDKEKFQGRGNLGIPKMVENSKPFSKKINLTVNPILALRKTISLKPGQEVHFDLLISASENKNVAIKNIEEYQTYEKVKKTFELSKAKADTESRYLNINATEINNYQKMLGYILFNNPIQNKENFKEQYYSKEQLWKYGISGDLPILLVKIKESNEKEILEEVLKAYEFFRIKNIQLDLVILNEESNSYEKYTKEIIQNVILNANLGYLQNIKNGIFVLEENYNEELLKFYAKLIIDAKNGPLKKQLKDLEDEYLENVKLIGEKVPTKFDLYQEDNNIKQLNCQENLLYYNSFGGFSLDGKEYNIFVNKENKLPTVWSHIMSNDKFGTLVTESMGGYTWSKNSRLNKITRWSNDQVIDDPSEIIYIQDEETLKSCSIGLNPIGDDSEYKVIYGFGYANYKHISFEVEQDLTVFVPKEDSLKVSLLNLKNLAPTKKKLNLIYYIKPILGEDELKNNGCIDIEYNRNNNILLLQNKINIDFKEKVYLCSNEKIKSYTGNKDFFIGNGNIANPDALKKVCLNNENGLGKNEIIAYQIEIELEAFSNRQIIFLLGAEDDEITCQDKAYQYVKIAKVEEELEKIKNKWKEELGKIQVTTPIPSFNILMNGWLTYQTITSRILARTGFYQSGGAYGFRDQLQDTIGLKYISSDIMKNQIIRHSKHQFLEGDVEHWWHEETNRGIRTRFSDDLLWLVYLVEEYIIYTGDVSILDIETPYIEGEKLEENIDERYDKHEKSEIKESIFIHCKRAIEKSLAFGENGLCKIGSGDWNDGLSKVGNKGKGESVWLSFFLYDILQKWIYLIEFEKENKETINKYKEIVEKLKKNLNNKAWDGRWYRRAFMDDGNILGTIQNEECKIDGIAQSWATISKAGDNDKKYISMESLENHLIDKENGIIKLLDPPFEKSNIDPGYIKSYIAGTRENGGQYTHAAIWAIIAETLLGFGNKAVELFSMINPIEHARTKEETIKYKVEPYVIAADIYGQGNLSGRGGWTWYTGSSSWMYEAGLHYILGFTIEKGYLSINPCIPNDWKEYKIHYKYGNTVYNINIKNPNLKNTGIDKMILNGIEIEEKKIKLLENAGINEVEIIM